MELKRSKGFYVVIIFALIALIGLSASVSVVRADMGPKPSVRVSFVGIGDKECYATLLANKSSYFGPRSEWDGVDEHAYHKGNYEHATLDYEIWKAFAEYEDKNGLIFLQTGWKVNDESGIAWTYYPPSVYKILLYFPASETFAVSDIYEAYAFDSYYTVNIGGVDIESVKEFSIRADKSYNYTWELVSLFVRIIATILIELGIAVLLRYRSKKQLLLIGCVNAGTQIILNVLLNILDYTSGSMMFMIAYIPLEIIVFLIEAIIFAIFLKRTDKVQLKATPYGAPQESKEHRDGAMAVFYAFVANCVSFFAGFGLAILIPGIF